jgi:hypothetical protein
MFNFLGTRWFQFFVVPSTVAAWFFVTDPSGGADTILRVQLWAQALLITGIAYYIAKSMLGKASSESLYKQALDHNTAAGIAYAGICLLRGLTLIGLLMFFATIQR